MTIHAEDLILSWIVKKELLSKSADRFPMADVHRITDDSSTCLGDLTVLAPTALTPTAEPLVRASAPIFVPT